MFNLEVYEYTERMKDINFHFNNYVHHNINNNDNSNEANHIEERFKYFNV